MKHILPLILVAVVACSSCNSNSVGSASQSGIGEGDEYDIYATVLHEMYDSSNVLLVLHDSSVTSFRGQFQDSVLFANLKERLPGLLNETLAGFVSVNENPARLMYVRDIPRLVLSSDYDGTHDGSKVDLSISRVGYDHSRTQAVVEIGELWGPLAGSGTMFLLVRENGKWKIEASCMTWIS